MGSWPQQLIGVFSLLFILGGGPVLAQTYEPVDVELILMADGSGSVDDDEFSLQRIGYARALRDPRVLGAIQGGALGKIAISYVEWSGPGLHVPIVQWTVIQSKEDILRVVKILETHPRELYGGGTAIGDAIQHGMMSIQDNAFEGRRKIIDISGDGPDRNGMPAYMGRDMAVKAGMIVNGLPILQGYLDLLEFFRENVIGGPGAFAIPARNFQDIETASRIKLIREIAGAVGRNHASR